MNTPNDAEFEFARTWAMHLYRIGKYRDAVKVASDYAKRINSITRNAPLRMGRPVAAQTLAWIARLKPAVLNSVDPLNLERLREELAEECLFQIPLKRDPSCPEDYFVKHSLMTAASLQSATETWKRTRVVKPTKIVAVM